MIAIGGSWPGIELWQTNDLGKPSEWRYLESVRGFRGWPSHTNFVAGTSLLLGATLGGDIKAWDTDRIGKRSFRAHARDAIAIRPLPSSGDVISASSDGHVRRWAPNT